MLWYWNVAPEGEEGLDTVSLETPHPMVESEALPSKDAAVPVMHPLQINVKEACVELT